MPRRDPLGEKLITIENKLGSTQKMPVGTKDPLGWHLDHIESLIDESSGGTKVIANPTLSGNEDKLLGIQIEDKKYKVESSSSAPALPKPTEADIGKLPMVNLEGDGYMLSPNRIGYMLNREFSWFSVEYTPDVEGQPGPMPYVIVDCFSSGSPDAIFDSFKRNVELIAQNLSIQINEITNLITLNTAIRAIIQGLKDAGQYESIGYALISALSLSDGFANVWDEIDLARYSVNGYMWNGQLSIAMPWFTYMGDGVVGYTTVAGLLQNYNIQWVEVKIPGLSN